MVAFEAWAHQQNRLVEIERIPRDIMMLFSDECMSFTLLESLESEKQFSTGDCLVFLLHFPSITYDEHMVHKIT